MSSLASKRQKNCRAAHEIYTHTGLLLFFPSSCHSRLLQSFYQSSFISHRNNIVSCLFPHFCSFFGVKWLTLCRTILHTYPRSHHRNYSSISSAIYRVFFCGFLQYHNSLWSRLYILVEQLGFSLQTFPTLVFIIFSIASVLLCTIFYLISNTSPQAMTISCICKDIWRASYIRILKQYRGPHLKLGFTFILSIICTFTVRSPPHSW